MAKRAKKKELKEEKISKVDNLDYNKENLDQFIADGGVVALDENDELVYLDKSEFETKQKEDETFLIGGDNGVPTKVVDKEHNEVGDIKDYIDEEVADKLINIEDKVDSLEADAEEISKEAQLLLKQIKTVKSNLKNGLATHKVVLQAKLAELQEKLEKL